MWIFMKPFCARVTFQSVKVFVAMTLTSFLVAACGITAGRIAVTFFAKGIITNFVKTNINIHLLQNLPLHGIMSQVRLSTFCPTQLY